MFTRNVLSGLAVIGAAAAQTSSSNVCSQSTTTINSQSDAMALSSCSTYSGNIIIGPSASGAIQLDGIQQLKGDFSVNNATGLTSLSSSSINSITGDWTMDSLTVLTTLSFTELTSVGSISWTALNALDTLTFPSFISQAKSVLISNTFLSSLAGINLATTQVLNINNNGRLKMFSTQVANVTQSINIDSNGNSLVVEFPNLITAANITFRNVSSASMPSLKSVNGSLGFYGNFFESFSAPNLTIVGNPNAQNTGSLAFVSNMKLTNISFPVLTTVQGANQVANNTLLTNISFPALKTVGGAIDFAGNFSTPDLGSLSVVSGGFNMQSNDQLDCSTFDADQKSGVILGKYTCKGNLTKVSSGVGSGTSTSSGASGTSTSKSAAMSYSVNDAVAGLSVVGGLLSMLL